MNELDFMRAALMADYDRKQNAGTQKDLLKDKQAGGAGGGRGDIAYRSGQAAKQIKKHTGVDLPARAKPQEGVEAVQSKSTWMDPLHAAAAGAATSVSSAPLGVAKAFGMEPQWARNLSNRGQADADRIKYGQMSDEALNAMEQSTPQGNLLSPSTWSMGEKPTIQGLGLQFAQVFGGMAPIIVAGAASAPAAAVTGVATAMGGAATGAEQAVMELTDEQIAKTPIGSQILKAGGSIQEARQAAANKAAQIATWAATPAGLLGGATAGKLAGKAGSGIGHALGEAGQEVGETVGQNIGVKYGAGHQDQELFADTFGSAVLGAGAGAGARGAQIAPRAIAHGAQEFAKAAGDMGPQAVPGQRHVYYRTEAPGVAEHFAQHGEIPGRADSWWTDNPDSAELYDPSGQRALMRMELERPLPDQFRQAPALWKNPETGAESSHPQWRADNRQLEEFAARFGDVEVVRQPGGDRFDPVSYMKAKLQGASDVIRGATSGPSRAVAPDWAADSGQAQRQMDSIESLMQRYGGNYEPTPVNMPTPTGEPSVGGGREAISQITGEPRQIDLSEDQFKMGRQFPEEGNAIDIGERFAQNDQRKTYETEFDAMARDQERYALVNPDGKSVQQEIDKYHNEDSNLTEDELGFKRTFLTPAMTAIRDNIFPAGKGNPGPGRKAIREALGLGKSEELDDRTLTELAHIALSGTLGHYGFKAEGSELARSGHGALSGQLSLATAVQNIGKAVQKLATGKKFEKDFPVEAGFVKTLKGKERGHAAARSLLTQEQPGKLQEIEAAAERAFPNSPKGREQYIQDAVGRARQWSPEKAAYAGVVLMNGLARAGLVSLVKEQGKGDEEGWVLKPSQDALDSMRKYGEGIIDFTEDRYEPTVGKMEDWHINDDGDVVGGVPSDYAAPINAVKGSGDKAARQMLLRKNDEQMRIPLESLNVHQNTPYRVNKTFLNVAQEMFERRRDLKMQGADMGGMPGIEPTIEPPTPEVEAVVQKYRNAPRFYKTDPKTGEVLMDEKRGKPLDDHEARKKAWKEQFDLEKNGEPTADWFPTAAERDLKAQFDSDLQATKEAIQASKSQVNQVKSFMKKANEFKDEPELHFAFNKDSRGRLYAVASTFHPQGHTELRAGLLEFSEPVEMDDEGAAWLAMSLAARFSNEKVKHTDKKGKTHSLSLDKAPYEDRLNWTYRNMDRVRRVAQAATDMDSLMQVFDDWKDAAEPLAFIRHCVELAGYENAKKAGQPFMSHLPIDIDATTSGLQIWAAIGQDANTGALVNLQNNEFPSDSYGAVATETVKQLEADDGNPLADWWKRFGVDRKVTKNPVMTLVYGAVDLASQVHQKTFFDLVRNYKANKATLKAKENSQTPEGQREYEAAQREWDKNPRYALLKELEDNPDLFIGKNKGSGTKFDQSLDVLANYLNDKMTEAIKVQFPAPYAGMAWLREVATVASQAAQEGTIAERSQAEWDEAESKRKEEEKAEKARRKEAGEEAEPKKKGKPAKKTVEAPDGTKVELQDKGVTVHHDKSGEDVAWLPSGQRYYSKDEGQGVDLHWTGFSGWPVQQEYNVRSRGKAIDIAFEGADEDVRAQPRLPQKTGFHDVSGQYLGLPPNFIHALDAAILDKVAVKMKEEYGVNSVRTIHDAYGVHASNIPKLRKAITEVLLELYDGDVLNKFYEEVRAQLPPKARGKLKPPPRFEDMPGFRKLKPEQISEQNYAFHP